MNDKSIDSTTPENNIRKDSLESGRNGRVKVNQKALRRWISNATDQTQTIPLAQIVSNHGSIFDSVAEHSVSSSVSISAKKNSRKSIFKANVPQS